jgi:hypothetical protein
MIEMKFVEITQIDTQSLGLDWFLGATIDLINHHFERRPDGVNGDAAKCGSRPCRGFPEATTPHVYHAHDR